jgi:xanthine dehydrogenase molybdenum-binding subunit
MAETTVVGKRKPRVDAVEKVTGRALYTADLHLPGMLYGAFLRSPYAHARIIRIDTSKAEKLPGVKAIITQASLNAEQALIIEEEIHATRRVLKLFAEDKVRYHGEKIAAIAATSREIAEEAAALIQVEYEPLPAVSDVREAVKEGAPRIHEDSKTAVGPNGEILYNVSGEFHRHEGDVEQGFAEADFIFEDEYIIPRVHQTYIEPQAAIADVDPSGNVTVWSSTQGHFAVRANIANSLRIPLSKINSIGMTIGGGFGGKFGGIVDTYAVLLAQKTGRPVMVAYTREEEFVDGRPAPGCVIHLKTGVKRDGRITARQAWALWDVGVASGGAGAISRARGVYDIPHFKVDGYDINTNKPAPGAYRAPGAPQVAFASECQMNRIAMELGLDPVELRLLNIREHSHQTGFKATLRAAAEKAGWWNRTKGENEGWGVAIGEWTNGAGPGEAIVSVHEDGSVHVFSGLMDITGTDTAMAQIAAEVLTVPYERVTVSRGDTRSAPYATASGGSVVTFSMGNAVLRAAEEAKQQVLHLAAANLNVPVEKLELRDGVVQAQDDPETSMTLAEIGQAALRSPQGPIAGRGGFANVPSASTIAAQIAKVQVDPETGVTTVLDFVGALDVGKAINPMACEGQMEGGAVQGMSWGLMEEMLFSSHDGRMMNPNLLDYRIPTSRDVPLLQSVIIEVPTDHGPFGAKGVGEPPIVPTLATVVSAIADATGVWVNTVPATPERVFTALQSQRRGK